MFGTKFATTLYFPTFHILTPVSYTHLDVYKRQGLGSNPWSGDDDYYLSFRHCGYKFNYKDNSVFRIFSRPIYCIHNNKE